MKYFILFSLVMTQTIYSATAGERADGMNDVESTFSVEETADRLETIFAQKGVTVFNRIKHSAAAEKVGVKLRPTELIIFGNPKLGSPMMKCKQSIAIDLPQKALIWKDENDKVWISYNDIKYIAKRHHVEDCEAIISKIEMILAKLIHAASHASK